MLILDADYDEKTIRLISDALANIDTQIMNHITYKALDKEITLHIGALQAIAFMRRLGVDDNEIKKRFISACDNLPIDMLKYIGGYSSLLWNIQAVHGESSGAARLHRFHYRLPEYRNSHFASEFCLLECRT